ncbi:MAG: hypothetical protein QXU88_01820 [Candidatus Woesearchaeota archaeon]
MLITLTILVIALSSYFLHQKTKVTNFDECIKAGNQIIETFPRQCVFNGKRFVEGIIRAALETSFHLKFNNTALIDDNIRVKFLRIDEDSRCPSDVLCPWEGQATIVVNIIKDNKNLGNFPLTIRAGGGENLSAKVFDELSIRLIKLEPYPRTDKKITPSDYVATLIVSKEK